MTTRCFAISLDRDSVFKEFQSWKNEMMPLNVKSDCDCLVWIVREFQILVAERERDAESSWTKWVLEVGTEIIMRTGYDVRLPNRTTDLTLWLHAPPTVTLTSFTSHASGASTCRIVVSSLFSERFVDKRCILQQKCLKKLIGSCLLGAWRYNF